MQNDRDVTQNVTQKDENVTQNDTQSYGEIKMRPEERRLNIIDMIKTNPNITAQEIAEKFNLTTRTIKRDIAKLTEEGLIKYEGSSKSGKWIVLK